MPDDTASDTFTDEVGEGESTEFEVGANTIETAGNLRRMGFSDGADVLEHTGHALVQEAMRLSHRESPPLPPAPVPDEQAPLGPDQGAPELPGPLDGPEGDFPPDL